MGLIVKYQKLPGVRKLHIETTSVEPRIAHIKQTDYFVQIFCYRSISCLRENCYLIAHSAFQYFGELFSDQNLTAVLVVAPLDDFVRKCGGRVFALRVDSYYFSSGSLIG